jgi:lactate 2-monooxygenase
MKPSALDRQREIYLQGFSSRKSKLNVDFKKLETTAKQQISNKAFAYIAGGAGYESTLRRNQEAFEKFAIVPRMLRNVGERDISIELFGQKLSTPFLLSPIGVLEMAYKEADLAVAKAASSLHIPYIFSNQASVPMEVCSAAMGNSSRWFQLYWSKSKDLVASFLQRADKCGCSAIVVTLDTTMLGWRCRDLELAYLPFLEGKGIAQYTSDPVFQKMMEELPSASVVNRKITLDAIRGLIQMVNNYPDKGFIKKLRSGKPMKAVQTFISSYTNPFTTWDDLRFLREQTKLPILLKGILHADDAQKALDYGMDGIIVSNHGGRQVDGCVSTIEMLPRITAGINSKIPILFDSGIRGGADVFKALALGANAVCVGRPYVYGLAINGEAGVREVLQNLMADFELTMGLAGCDSISKITKECLISP